VSLSWFPFYHGDYLRDTSRLSPSQHGTYLLLLVSFFNDGPLPNDPDTLCRIAAGSSPTDVHEILKRYWVLTDGGWVNLKMDGVRQECIARDESNRKRAIEAAHARWGNGKSLPKPMPKPLGEPSGECSEQCLEHSSEQCTSTTTSTSTSKTKRERATFVAPSPHEVAEYARGLGYSGWDQEAVKFVAFYGAKGWMIGKSPMKDWKAAVVGWQARRKAEAKSATSREVFS
jgi:uncharacterized protein YdaU (DUF1376 family)